MNFLTRYSRESTAQRAAGLFYVFLAAALGQVDPEPTPAPTGLFEGTVAQPLVFRNLLTGLHNVVDARFYRPDLWRYLDPVITCGGDRLRMECFSSCASVYARVDFTPNAFSDGRFRREGTTNVDFGGEFLRHLGTLRPGEPARFEMGEESVTLRTVNGTAVERKVTLPDRWVRGFLQVQAVQRHAEPVFDLNRFAARHLLHQIPANAADTVYLAPSGTQCRVFTRKPATGEKAVAVTGVTRLRLLAAVAADVQSLRAYQVDTGASVWVADTGAARLTLGLSGQVQNGFSGDGDALRTLGGADFDDLDFHLAKATVANLNCFTVDEFAVQEGIDRATAVERLDRLAGHGVLGYDRDADQYFHRVLPFLKDEKALPNRVKNSKKLLENDRVRVETNRPDGKALVAAGWVRGDTGLYRVEIDVDAAGRLASGRCGCAWIEKHGLQRGPCKHMLALRFACADATSCP